MQTRNLYNTEIYRFFHSIFIFVCMSAVFLGILFLAVDHSDALISDGTLWGNVSAVLKIANLMVTLIVSVVISGYIGREFKQKTIDYEVMSGCPFWKISLIKTVTCGILIPVMLLVCILLFLAVVSGNIQKQLLIPVLFMFFILCHICSCTALYVMLCRNGILGGCLSFVRFTLLEVAVLFAAGGMAPEGVYSRCKEASVMSQWSVVIHMDIPPEYRISIVMSGIVEYVILLALIQFFSKRVDF